MNTTEARENLVGPGSANESFKRLAALPAAEYDQQRKHEARRIGIRVATLDAEVKRLCTTVPRVAASLNLSDPEPWPDPVSGDALVREISETFKRHLVLVEHAELAMTLWVLHAHGIDAADITPRLVFASPEKRCGKTTAQTIIASLVPRPLAAANITTAATFRVIEAAHPTLVVDEADSFIRDNDQLRGILNSGHNRANAYVVRCVGDDAEPRRFCTWAAVSIALIGRLPSTLEDRSIIIRMRRRSQTELVSRLTRDARIPLATLCRKAARWASDNLAVLRSADPRIPATLDDRAADNWRPLLAVADCAGGNWPELARHAARLLSGPNSDSSTGVTLLLDLRTLFAATSANRMSSSAICQALATMEDRPWKEYRRGTPISQPQLANLLAPFGIGPHTIRLGSETPKGYEKADFQDAFVRYLLPNPAEAATTPQSPPTAA